MIKPEKVKYMARKKTNENMRFRTFLKMNADDEELDQQFKVLHKEMFAKYDCKKCLNCCKQYAGSVPIDDLEKDALYLNMTKESFIHKYLKQSDNREIYDTIHTPCDFLQDNGECLLGECKPEGCQTFPYTDQPNRLSSLYSVLSVIEVCPVAFEIFERLKVLYDDCGIMKY